MKAFTTWIVVLTASVIVLSGCSKSEQTAPTPTPPPSAPAAATAPQPATPPQAPTPPQPAATVSQSVQQGQQSMADLLASAKDGVNQAMTLAQQGKYQDALNLLQQKYTEVQANPDAKKLIEDAMAKVKEMMANAATQAVTDKANQAVGGLGNALPK